MKKPRTCNCIYITHMGAAPIEPISTNFGKSFRFTDVIMRSRVIGIDWYSSFSYGEVHSSSSKKGTKNRPYHMYVVPAGHNSANLFKAVT